MTSVLEKPVATEHAARTPRRSPRRTLAAMAFAVWLPLVLLAVWWFASANSTSPFFPPLRLIVDQLWNEWILGDSKLQVIPSVTNLLIGYVLGSLIGVIAGTALWRFPTSRRATSPFIFFLYALPAPALLPALVALFGIGETRQIALIAFGAIWPTLLNTLDGMRGIDEVKFDTAKAMRLSSRRVLLQVVLPGASPQIAAGLRASLQVSIILMVVSELIGARAGIGYAILQAQATFSIVQMWAGILVLAFVGTLLNGAFVVIERRCLRWYAGARRVDGATP